MERTSKRMWEEMETNRKVLAYITKGTAPDEELLVFEFKNNDKEGFFVPGGTIEPGELIMDAIYREIEEETGIQQNELELVGKLNKTNHFPEDRDKAYERTFFQFTYIGEERDAWEHVGTGSGEDRGLVFSLRFIPLKQLPTLGSNQDQALEFIM